MNMLQLHGYNMNTADLQKTLLDQTWDKDGGSMSSVNVRLTASGYEGWQFGEFLTNKLGKTVQWEGSNADMGVNAKLVQLLNKAQLGNPIMLVVQIVGYGQHWVVCIGKTNTGYTFVDPDDHSRQFEASSAQVANGIYYDNGQGL